MPRKQRSLRQPRVYKPRAPRRRVLGLPIPRGVVSGGHTAYEYMRRRAVNMAVKRYWAKKMMSVSRIGSPDFNRAERIYFVNLPGSSLDRVVTPYEDPFRHT